MSTLHAGVATKAKVSDSGGVEAGSESGAFGAPESWTFRDIVRAAGAVVTRNPRLVASLVGLTGVAVGLDFLAGQPQVIQQVLGFPVGLLALGATHMTVVEEREGLTLEEVAGRYLGRVGPVLKSSLVLLLVAVSTALVGAGGLAAIHGLGYSTLAGVLGFLLFFAWLAALALPGQLLVQEAVLGGTSGTEALARSYALTRGQLGGVFGPVFGIHFLTQAIVIAGALMAIVPGVTVVAVTPAAYHGLVGLVAGTLGVVLGGLVGIWATAAYGLVYLRARARA